MMEDSATYGFELTLFPLSWAVFGLSFVVHALGDTILFRVSYAPRPLSPAFVPWREA